MYFYQHYKSETPHNSTQSFVASYLNEVSGRGVREQKAMNSLTEFNLSVKEN
jgi:hypothetical protein